MSQWKIRTAKKLHRCSFCYEPIAPGSQYAHIRLTPWDHPDNECFFTVQSLRRFRRCCHCVRMATLWRI